jgi:hypothetical protein
MKAFAFFFHLLFFFSHLHLQDFSEKTVLAQLVRRANAVDQWRNLERRRRERKKREI